MTIKGISPRHQAREVAMEAIYEWDVTDHDPFVALDIHLVDRHSSPRVAQFAHDLVQLVVTHVAQIDGMLAATAAERPLAEMARIEKAILRLAISEILFDNGVPARAVINEAVELAKTYGGENSARFVNGVLGAIFTKIEESRTGHSPTQQLESESEDQHNVD